MALIHATAIVEDGAKLAEDVKVGPFTYIYAGTEIGAGSVIEGWCEVGRPFPGREPAKLGAKSVLRSHSTVYAGAILGEGLMTGHGVIIREGTVAGRNFQLGVGSEIQGDCVIGDYVCTQSKVFIPKGCKVGNFCWLLPGVTLTNDPTPPSYMEQGVVLEDFVVLSAQVVVLPGVTVRHGAVVGANSTVTKDVEAGRLVVGSPARDKGPAEQVKLRDGSDGVAYPWTTHFKKKYPDEITRNW